MIVRPTQEWIALGEARPSWYRSLLGYALPLALLPALGWPAGQIASDSVASSMGLPAYFAAAFFSTLAFSLLTVLLLALGFYLLAPMFDVRRDWPRCMAIAAHSGTPVFVTGALLVSPVLAVVAVVGLFHCCALCYLGLQQLLGCRETDAAMFVAIAGVFTAVASMLLGALCSAAGLL